MSILKAGQVYRERYRIVRQLGRGGTSDVYLLNDLRLPRTPCLKKAVVRGNYTLARLRAVFANEARVLRKLDGAGAHLDRSLPGRLSAGLRRAGSS